jgi:hypothetical protein
MPFYRVSLDAYEEIVSELGPENLPPELAENPPSGEFEYRIASGRYAPEDLGPVARVILEAMRVAGATGFRVRYDGGYDEGFAHPEPLLFGQEARATPEVLREVATAELATHIREAAGRESIWGNATEMYAAATPAEAATYALDELAGELATILLGSGFGTGECELYGAFLADFETGNLVDDPNAAKPEGME